MSLGFDGSPSDDDDVQPSLFFSAVSFPSMWSEALEPLDRISVLCPCLCGVAMCHSCTDFPLGTFFSGQRS